jgi:hypothetical protein
MDGPRSQYDWDQSLPYVRSGRWGKAQDHIIACDHGGDSIEQPHGDAQH